MESWVLAGQLHGPVWIAFQLVLDPAGDASLTGATLGKGVIVDQPINSSGGVFLPVNSVKSNTLERLEADAFKKGFLNLNEM